MTVTRRSAALVAFLLAACGRAAGPAADEGAGAKASGPRPDDVVAEVDGQKIDAAELDRHAAGALQQIREQEYEARRNALEDLIDQRLMEKEARARGISAQDLRRLEIDARVAPPPPDEIREVYEQNRDRVGGRSLEEIAPQIVASLVQQRTAARVQAFTRELRDNAKIRILLEQPRTEVALAEGAQVQGPADAPVTIIEYSDYLCPYCQRAEEAVAKVLARHPGKVRFAHRDFLLGRPRSMAVAKAALCAGDQGKFWEYRRDLLTTAGDWTDRDLESRAGRLGVGADAFRACLASDRHEQAIRDSSEEARKLGVTGTPTFFVNGRRMTGVRSEADFEAAIIAELGRRG
jgi:protein-disulfide isomerase